MVEMSVQAMASRRNSKSPEAFRTISEVADELAVPQHVLRFWESKFTQVKPLKRGGGRRYYRPEDVELLRRIRALLYEDGYTIKGVQKLLRENGRRLPSEVARPSPPPRILADRPGLSRAKAQEIESAVNELSGLKEMLRRRARER